MTRPTIVSCLRSLAMMSAIFASCALAQAERVPILVDHSGEDSVGQSVAFELKEQIRRSGAFRLISDGTQARIVLTLLAWRATS